MSAAPQDQPGICPRCRSATVTTFATSPVAGVWQVFGCATCRYTWRSSEPRENRDPAQYPPAFRLDPTLLADLATIPAIPPLRSPPD